MDRDHAPDCIWGSPNGSEGGRDGGPAARNSEACGLEGPEKGRGGTGAQAKGPGTPTSSATVVSPRQRVPPPASTVP